MPAMTRLAANGAARNETIVMSIGLLRSGGFDRGGQLRDVVVEQLEVVGHFLFTSYRRRQLHDLGAGLRSNRVGCLRIEVRLDDDELHAVALDLLDQLERVRR